MSASLGIIMLNHVAVEYTYGYNLLREHFSNEHFGKHAETKLDTYRYHHKYANNVELQMGLVVVEQMHCYLVP
jgi:hypothetical protein